MNNCKNCTANTTMCQYCIFNKENNNVENEDINNDKLIFYNNEQYDGTSKKICPVCRKIYTGYPAASRKDNKTLICSDCGMKEVQEPLEKLLEELELF